MNNKTQMIGLSVAMLVFSFVAGLAGGHVGSVQMTGGDFPGGIQPSNLFNANVGGGYVQPIGSFAFATPNGFYLGGTTQYNQESLYVTASGTPLSAGATLGPLGSTTSTATTSITVFNSAGLSIGAICSGGTATTTTYISGCLLNSTNGATGTAIVAYSNILGSANTVPSTTRISVTFDQLPY